MKNVWLWVVLMLVFALVAPAQTADLQRTFPSMAATGNTAAVGTGGPNSYYSNHTVQAALTGSPTGCSFRLYGTAKLPSANPAYPADYEDLSGAVDCTTTKMVHVAYKPVTQIVVVLSTLSGGTSPTVTFSYVGKK